MTQPTKDGSVVLANSPLLAFDIVRKHLIESDWRALAEWSRVAPPETKVDFASIEMWSKNGRVLLLMSQRDGGFELFFPSPSMKTVDCLAEINGYGELGVLPESQHQLIDERERREDLKT